MAKKRSSENTRNTIIRNFAMWAAMSAARTVGTSIYGALAEVQLENLYAKKGIRTKSFNDWHKEETEKLAKKIKKDVKGEKTKQGAFAWAAKMLNIMLKVEVYIGGRGNQKLVSCIHPPFDNSLKGTLGKNLKENNIDPKKIEQILKKVPEHPFSEIAKYSQYKELMEGLEEARKILEYKTLIELEELWEPDKKSG